MSVNYTCFIFSCNILQKQHSYKKRCFLFSQKTQTNNGIYLFNIFLLCFKNHISIYYETETTFIVTKKLQIFLLLKCRNLYNLRYSNCSKSFPVYYQRNNRFSNNKADKIGHLEIFQLRANKNLSSITSISNIVTKSETVIFFFELLLLYLRSRIFSPV